MIKIYIYDFPFFTVNVAPDKNIMWRQEMHSGVISPITRRPTRDRILDRIFGYDYFISYAWEDGWLYASALAQKLEAQDFEVFLDRNRYAAGDDWRSVGEWTLRRTGQLILVGSNGALQSAPVRHELQIFKSTGRRIIPINFEGSLDWRAEDSLHELLGKDKYIQIREEIKTLEYGPSESALSKIKVNFDLTKQDKKRSRILLVSVSVLFLLTISAFVAAYYAFSNAREARNERDNAERSLAQTIEARNNEKKERDRADVEEKKAFEVLISGIDRFSDFSDTIIQSIKRHEISRDTSLNILTSMEDSYWKLGESGAISDFRKSQIGMVFQKIASAYFSLGDRERSLAAWQRFVDFSRRLVVEYPDNPALVTALAAALIRLAGERASNADRSGQAKDLLEATQLFQRVAEIPTLASFSREGFSSGGELRVIALQDLAISAMMLVDALQQTDRKANETLLISVDRTLKAALEPDRPLGSFQQTVQQAVAKLDSLSTLP